MTPKEKAKELFNKYCFAIRTEETDSGYFTNVIYAKYCALIAVDEVIEALHEHHWQNRLIIDYWEEVKHEINNL